MESRSQSLKICLDSLERQTFKDFEIILVTERGNLVELRNEGAKRSKGKFLVFIDDDVICEPRWMESIVSSFYQGDDIGGVSGPAIITLTYRRNRDLFRFTRIKKLYDWMFLDGKSHLPGHFTSAGAWTTGATSESCSYQGDVEFLEACNMVFRRDVFFEVGGFDEQFKGVGDWSEPDLSFRIRQRGYRLWFCRDAKLFHQPSRTRSFSTGSQNRQRYANYELLSNRWFKPCFKHSLYKLFLKGYYKHESIIRRFGR